MKQNIRIDAVPVSRGIGIGTVQVVRDPAFQIVRRSIPVSRLKQEIRRLADLCPMENPHNLRGIEACERLVPGVPQVAVFDTAFHLRMPPAAHRYALPGELAGDGELRRYGGHGISHEGAAHEACAFLGRVAHLIRRMHLEQ